jgi:Holliday junction resolvase RusA-like endonuclease
VAVLRIVAPMPPGLLAINARDKVVSYTPRQGKRAGELVHRIGKDAKFRAAEIELHVHVRQAVVLARWRELGRLVPVFVRIGSYWPEDKGDVDACSKAAQDSLHHCGVVADDDQVAVAVLERVWRVRQPRIELDVCTSLSELVGLLGWSR